MTKQDFYHLGQMIGGYLHQDMDIEANNVPEAIAVFACKSDPVTRNAVLEEMHAFSERFHNRVGEEFAVQYGHDFEPKDIGQSVGEFFDMVAVILADPTTYTRYLDEDDIA